MAAGHQLVDTIMGEDFVSAGEREVELGIMVQTEVKASTPVLLCSAPGFDASGRVDELATERNRQITSIAIGSAEGFSKADKAISSAVEWGRWVMLKNVHLAPQWLVQLEKKLHSIFTAACRFPTLLNR
jgi:dynein heavy chain 1